MKIKKNENCEKMKILEKKWKFWKKNENFEKIKKFEKNEIFWKKNKNNQNSRKNQKLWKKITKSDFR